jgi:hypothetical protein
MAAPMNGRGCGIGPLPSCFRPPEQGGRDFGGNTAGQRWQPYSELVTVLACRCFRCIRFRLMKILLMSRRLTAVPNCDGGICVGARGPDCCGPWALADGTAIPVGMGPAGRIPTVPGYWPQ